MIRARISRIVFAAVLVAISATVIHGSHPAPRHNLFVDWNGDPNFLEYSDCSTYSTSPLSTFDANDLDSSFGATETTQIRNGVMDILEDAFFEFDLGVLLTAPSSGNFQTLGVDSTSATLTNPPCSQEGNLFGKARSVDTDPDDDDYARTWSNSFGGYTEFQGSNSTVARWTRAIGYTSAHEVAHNYGATHGDSALTTGETAAGDDRSNHIMATGSTGITMEERATLDRHFGDNSYSKLAANLGLATKTLNNWDFLNPNDLPANDFHIEFLSMHDSLTVNWEYSLDPFGTPSVNNVGTQSYMGTTYNKYEVVWSGGMGVDAGAEFHTGITFEEDYDFVIIDTYLTQDGTELPLKPRMISYGDGDTDADGIFSVPIRNASDMDLLLRDVRFRLVPRMIDLEAMTDQFRERPITRHGLDVSVDGDIRFDEMVLEPGEIKHFPIADAEKWLASRRCKPRPITDVAQDAQLDGDPNIPSDEAVCTYLDMFPASYIYATATAVIPNSKVWNPNQQQFVIQDLETDIFTMIAGQPRMVSEPSFQAVCDFDGRGCGLSDMNLLMRQGDLTVGVRVSSGNQFDLNNDNTINESDIGEWLIIAGKEARYGSPFLAGDTDGLSNTSPTPRTVDITDFQNFLTGFTGTGDTWDVGNFNGDSNVDITDFSTIFLRSFKATGGRTYGPSQSIPEPSTVLLLGVGGLMLGYLGWRRVGSP